MKAARILGFAGALALMAGASAGGGVGAGAAPTIRIFDLAPAKARGAHFAAGEVVHVTLRAGAVKRVRTTRASAAGAFTVDFGALGSPYRCSGSISVSANGGQGDHAVYKLPPLACPALGGER